MTLAEDFTKAHRHAIFQQIFSAFKWNNPDKNSMAVIVTDIMANIMT